MAQIGMVIIDDDGTVHKIHMHDLTAVIAKGEELAKMQSDPAHAAKFSVPFDFGFPGIDIGTAIQTAKCSLACKPRSGFGACVATCVATSQVCDGGVDNCKPL